MTLYEINRIRVKIHILKRSLGYIDSLKMEEL